MADNNCDFLLLVHRRDIDFALEIDEVVTATLLDLDELRSGFQCMCRADTVMGAFMYNNQIVLMLDLISIMDVSGI